MDRANVLWLGSSARPIVSEAYSNHGGGRRGFFVVLDVPNVNSPQTAFGATKSNATPALLL